jgi:hypothetical protein
LGLPHGVVHARARGGVWRAARLLPLKSAAPAAAVTTVFRCVQSLAAKRAPLVADTTCSPARRIRAAHSRYPPLCAAEGRLMVCNVLELFGCIRSCAAAQRRRPTCARPGAAAATCSRCWRCWPWPCGQLPVGARCLEATPSWSTAAAPQRISGAVAQPQCSQSCATAEPVQPEHVYSMLMHG